MMIINCDCMETGECTCEEECLTGEIQSCECSCKECDEEEFICACGGNCGCGNVAQSVEG